MLSNYGESTAFDRVFTIIAIAFILALAVVSAYRGGKDLKVGLFGVEQTLQKKSPYENPTDPSRAIFRYAPGFAILQYPFLLKSEMVAPFQFRNITLSVLAWYFIGILSLLISARILLKLIPAASDKISLANLKISLLMSVHLIGYELSNGQNKLLALFFILLAIFWFERDKMFLSGLSFSLAITVYIPLLIFALYFIVKKPKKFMFGFIPAVFIIFLVVPSLIFGPGFNLFLLKDWFIRAIKPFFLTTTYATYIDLRRSSQSLPSAIGRIFVSGNSGHFNYIIPPLFIHLIIRTLSLVIVLLSGLVAWRHQPTASRGLVYAVFLTLALILPQYCIYYTWSWLFVLYFAVFNYISRPEAARSHKRILLTSIAILFISTCGIGLDLASHLSLIFWATLLAWAGIITTLYRREISL